MHWPGLRLCISYHQQPWSFFPKILLPFSSLLLVYAPLHTCPALRKASLLASGFLFSGESTLICITWNHAKFAPKRVLQGKGSATTDHSWQGLNLLGIFPPQCSAGFPFLQCASGSNSWEDKRWWGKTVYKIPLHTGCPCRADSSPWAAAACSRSSVQTCPQDAVGGASQHSTREGGGTIQTVALSGRGDGSSTTLTAVLPLNSPISLLSLSQWKAERDQDTQKGIFLVPLTSVAGESSMHVTAVFEFTNQESWRKWKMFCPDQVPSEENWRRQSEWSGPGQEWLAATWRAGAKHHVLCGSHDPSPNAPKLLHCLEEEPASQAQSCQKESTLRWSCGLLFRLMNNTNHCFWRSYFWKIPIFPLAHVSNNVEIRCSE